MIISFTARNYKSIRDEVTLNFNVESLDGIHAQNIAYPDKAQKIPVLRSAGLWGPNASGKSNLLEALVALCDLVRSSHANELDQPIDEYRPFKLDPEYGERPVFFELEFIGRDRLRYVYSIEFSRRQILSESLYFYPGVKPAKLFERTANSEQTGWFGSKLTGVKAMPCLENRSYLSVAAQHEKSSTQLKDIFRFFRDDINFLTPNRRIFSSKILEQESYRNALGALLACADTGIQEVNIKEEELALEKLPTNIPEKIKQQLLYDFKLRPVFRHNGSEEWFELDDESAGTQRLYEIAPMIIMGVSSSEVWILDEFDCKLHPRIAEVVIRLFHDVKVNGNNPQLIFSSHNTALMNSDLLRRDQIWLTQKGADGATELTGLDEYNQVRADTNFEKWYREGRFEAIPEVKYTGLQEAVRSNSSPESHHE